MAEYTMTLQEVIQETKTPLLNPTLVIYDREHLEQSIINHFLFREIAFSTPEQFKWKLNAYVAERAQSYNKMFTSQLIEIDPFVTDYIVQSNSGNQKIKETKEDIQTQFNNRDSTYTSDTSSDSTENYKDSDESKHYKENTGVELKAILTSESENKNNRQDKTTSLSHDETTSETTDTTKNNTKTENNSKNETHSQTARAWTEKGSSSGHNLDVHSDTPQAMLFNTPPDYTGTGRMHSEGKNLGTEQATHYPESDPANFDTASYAYNSGDSPWFNYASSADNKIGHDSYSKEGTETFTKTDSVTETKSSIDDETLNSKTKGSKEFTEHGTENVSGSDSRSLNSNEHTKGDTKTQENYKDSASSTADTVKNNIGKRADSTATKTDTASNRNQNNTHETSKNDESVRKGRTMRSPSKLLDEYRQTLTFNADLWLFGELEPLFMQLF